MRKLVIFDINNVLCKRITYTVEDYDCVYSDRYCYAMKPNILTFLESCNEKYDIALWTSGSENEMRKVVEYLKGPDYKFIWYADKCVKSIKLEHKVEGYDDFLIVDDDEYKTRTFKKRIILYKMNVNNRLSHYECEYVSIMSEIDRLFSE